MNSEKLRAGRASLLALACTGFLALACSGRTAYAQAAPAEARTSAPGDDAAYKELIEQALSEFKHKNWPEARVLFMRAHEQYPNARTLRGMGIVSFEMRDYLNAVINLKAALEDTHQALTEAQRKECESLLSRARTYVGVYTLKLDPPETRVSVDGGEPTHDEEGHVLLPFGEHTLVGRAAGRQDTTLRLNVQGGERGEIALVLQAERGPEPRLAAQPAATVAPQELAKESANADARPRSEEPQGFVGHGLKYSWITLGLSAAAGGAAVAFWMLGGKKLDKLNDSCALRAGADNACTRENTNTDTVKTYQLLTNVGIGVSAAALVTTAVLMGLEWPRERRVALNVGPTSLSLSGAF
jgi:tetratricopeptide (TPR) repeat protein